MGLQISSGSVVFVYKLNAHCSSQFSHISTLLSKNRPTNQPTNATRRSSSPEHKNNFKIYFWISSKIFFGKDNFVVAEIITSKNKIAKGG